MHILAQTPRIIIRQFVPEEEYLYLDLYADEQVTQFIRKRTVEETRKLFKERTSQYGSGLGSWAMFNAADDDFIGVCGLRPADEGDGNLELGYVLGQRYWGKGLAAEMVNSLIEYAFDSTPADEICAVTMPLNIASQRVLEKAGFIRRGNIMRDGEELFFFSIEKSNKIGDKT